MFKMFNRYFNDAFYMVENHLNRCNDTDFPTKQHRPNISDKSTTSPKKSNIRIMGRDYSLILTTYERIAIEIRIDLCFPMSTWKLLLQQEPEILQGFRNDTTLSHQDPIIFLRL